MTPNTNEIVTKFTSLMTDAAVVQVGSAWTIKPIDGFNLPGITQGQTFTSRQAAIDHLNSLVGNFLGVDVKSVAA